MIVPYFGKWPFWFDAYLLSVAKNPSVNWLFVTDCEIPLAPPPNTKFKKSSLQEFNNQVNTVLDLQIPLSPRKICDLRVAFGKIFSSELANYDFWGYCDVDIIWGDIRKFITEEKLNSYDIISSRKEHTSGHFTLFRNTDKLNHFYNTIPEVDQLFCKKKLQRMDEDVLSSHLKQTMGQEINTFKVCWDQILLNSESGRDSHQEYAYNKWIWDNGKLFQLQNKKVVDEVMYLHFINWKRTLKKSEVSYKDDITQFYISSDQIHLKLHSKISENFRLFLNLFNGYKVREQRRIARKRRRKNINKIKNRLKL